MRRRWFQWATGGVLAGLVALAGMGWAALTLAEAGIFRWGWALAAGGLAGGLAGWTLGRPSAGPAGGSPPGGVAVALGLGAITAWAAWSAFPPGELILGNWDPGVYQHTAAQMVRHGSLQFPAPDLAALDAEGRDLYTRQLYAISEPFGGMRLLGDGRVTPQFYHLYPALLAVAHGLGGIQAALAVNPLLHLFSVWGIFLLASRLLGDRRPALLATLALALNPIQIWQAKFCTAELLAQALFIWGFYALARAADPAERRRAGWGLLAGGLIGATLLARYDALIPLAVLGVFWAWTWRMTDRPAVAIAAPALGIGLLAVQAWWHQQVIAPFYAPLSAQVKPLLALAGGLGALGLAWNAGPAAWRERILSMGRRVDSRLRRAAAIGVGLWLFFVGWVRPALRAGGSFSAGVDALARQVGWARGSEVLMGEDPWALAYLRDAWGMIALALAFVGLLIFLMRERRIWALSWGLGALGSLLVLSVNVHNDAFMMWVTRRFVPSVLPLLAIGFAAAAMALVTGFDRLRVGWGRWLAAAVCAGALLLTAPSTWAMARHRDWPGLVDWFDRVSARLPADALVVCDQPGFAAPLRFLYGFRTLELRYRGEDARSRMLADLARRAAQGPVYLLTGNDEALDDAPLEAQELFVLRSEIFHTYRRGVPREMKMRGAELVLYRHWPPGHRTPTRMKLHLKLAEPE